MTYAIIKVINGNYSIHAEGITSLQSARIGYHQLCAALWNDPGTKTAMVMVADENLDAVEGIKEFITHPVENENEPE